MKLYYSKVVVDGRMLDLLLDEEEIEKANNRALQNPSLVVECTESHGNCWPCEKPPKCGFWDRVMNNCCQCKEHYYD
jgi:hypothetical protein